MVWKINFTTLSDPPLNVTIFIMHERNCVLRATPMTESLHFANTGWYLCDSITFKPQY